MKQYITRKTIEFLATAILNAYSPDILTNPQALDVYDFIENYMGLTVDFKNLSQDISILGLTTFNEGYYPVWNTDRTEKELLNVKKGTIILENSLLEDDYEGRERFTAMHEAGHQILHRKVFENKPTVENEVLICAKRDIEQKKDKLKTPRDFIEWQANAIAAALLMPADAVRKLFLELVKAPPGHEKLPYGLTFKIDMQIFDIAKVFNVSFEAMRIRLQQLDLIYVREYTMDWSTL